MSDFTEEINLTIKKNLPAHVGDILQKELEALKNLRANFDGLKERYDALQRKLDDANNRVANLQSALQDHGDITKRFEAVAARERTQDLRDLKVELFDKRHSEMLGLVGMVFRSPVYQEHVKGYIPVPVEGNPGNPTYGHSPTGGTVMAGSIDKVTTTQQL